MVGEFDQRTTTQAAQRDRSLLFWPYLQPAIASIFRLCQILILTVSGCHLHDIQSFERIPDVSTRYTQNPLPPESREGKGPELPVVMPQMKVGLAMQAGPDSVHTRFAGMLGTVLIRELQLSSANVTVQPLTSLQLRLPVPTIDARPEGSVTTVGFNDAQSGLPPALPPNPLFLSKTPPLVDQILVVRVIEYRPYFPFLATLDIQVLDGDSQDLLFSTTASWSGVDYRLDDLKPKRSWRKPFACNDPKCDPSPAHNSPQALMHEISKDIAAWYTKYLTSVPVTEIRPPAAKRRWKFSFQKDDCEPCDAR